MQKLIILRGAPSSGKSTIAKKLRDFKKRIVWLKVDVFKAFFADEASNALKYVNESATATLEYLLSRRFSVVMEGIFLDPKYISLATKVANEKNVKYKVYELECSLAELQKRDKNRPSVRGGHRKPLGDEVVERIYNIIKNRPWEDAVKLNTEQLSPKECVEVLKKELESPTHSP